jgi:hypothetical protein
MGVVYKAEDIKLQRTVALKFLPQQWVSDPEARERFIHEARAASALDHPHICNIHEIEETEDGRMYIAMACYEGESLKDKIKRGPLDKDEAVEIAAQVAQGMTKAHQKGIAHRDLVRLGANVGIGEAAAFAAALAAGGVIVYSFWLILATLAFWFVRVENMLQFFSSMYEAGRWPVGFYPRWLRFMLTFLIPVAFATTVPAQALAGRLTWQTLAGAFALAAALAILSRLFWRVGVRRYSSASS